MMPRLEGRVLDRRDDEGARWSRSATAPGCGRCRSGGSGDRYCVASESCAFDIIGAELLREVLAGRDDLARASAGSRRARSSSPSRKAFCVFEHIYFARPDSILEGNRTQVSRRKMGEILWREAPVEADVVIAVPDSGQPGGVGLLEGVRASRATTA